jgi:hypothetical protein
MSDSYQNLDDDQLRDLLAQHRRNLAVLERQAAGYGPQPPLPLHNQLLAERAEAGALLGELRRRGVDLGFGATGEPLLDAYCAWLADACNRLAFGDPHQGPSGRRMRLAEVFTVLRVRRLASERHGPRPDDDQNVLSAPQPRGVGARSPHKPS